MYCVYVVCVSCLCVSCLCTVDIVHVMRKSRLYRVHHVCIMYLSCAYCTRALSRLSRTYVGCALTCCWDAINGSEALEAIQESATHCTRGAMVVHLDTTNMNESQSELILKIFKPLCKEMSSHMNINKEERT